MTVNSELRHAERSEASPQECATGSCLSAEVLRYAQNDKSSGFIVVLFCGSGLRLRLNLPIEGKVKPQPYVQRKK